MGNIRTIGIALLILASGVGLVSGVWLIRTNRVSDSLAWDCSKYVFSLNTSSGAVSVRNDSTRNEPSQQARVFIDDSLVATFDVPSLVSGGSSADLGTVSVPGGSFQWRIVGTKDCRNEGSVTTTSTPTSTPNITAQCLEVKVFDTDWNRIPSSDFASIAPGDTLRFTVSGNTTGGTIDMARFTIDGALRSEVVQKRPGSDEFYDEYTIPLGASGFSVKAEIHHTSLGWF